MSNHLLERIRSSVIGEGRAIPTPFGLKPLIYADYTASGRSLSFIEDYIRDEVLPLYANTHSESSYTGASTTRLREQARQSILDSVNADADDHLIFCGSGATAAIDRLIDIMNLRLPADLNERHSLLASIPHSERPVVFIGGYEHHSNELPWRESIADVVVIGLDDHGQLNQAQLRSELERYADRELKIGSFSAASNVTGLKTDTGAITALLHEFAALSFWDYAAGGPYLSIDMNPQNGAYKDAVFLSPHKFVGGPGTPGILLVKKQLLNNRVPAVAGGGTVLYVSPDDHRYLDDPQRREEGGTPGIIESIRAGLVFRLKEEVGEAVIDERESSLRRRALTAWSEEPAIEIMGNNSQDSLPIFSFRIARDGDYLHYGFVVALLNDLFGIQARGGCSCAGPYGHELLGLDRAQSRAIEKEVARGNSILRPGWTRLNFTYFMDDASADYIINAVKLIARIGWRLLPFYSFDPSSGTWRYAERTHVLETQNALPGIAQLLSPTAGAASASMKVCPELLQQQLELAEQELVKDRSKQPRLSLLLSDSVEKLRWFTLPQAIELEGSVRSVA